MRRFIAICIMLTTALGIYAQTEINGICYELDITTKTSKVTPGGKYSGSVTIPASVTKDGVEYKVTEIGDEAFIYCFELTNINIPNSIIAIGNSAFWNCAKLEALDLPTSVTKIGYYAFGACHSLKSIFIPKSVTDLGYAAFSECKNLTSFSIDSENPVYKFEDGMLLTKDNTTLVSYMGDRSLTKVTIPSTVKTIFNRAFVHCDWLTEVVIPNSVTTIGERAFSVCSALADVVLPNSIKRIEMFAFEECKSIKSIEIKEGVEFIGLGAFAKCENMTGISFPGTATIIEDWVLDRCKNLQKIVVAASNPNYDSRNDCNALIESSTNTLLYGSCNTVIPESVTAIRGTSFENIGIKHLYIPSSVTTIGDYAFRGCFALESIVVDPANPNYDSRDNCNALIEKESNTLIRGSLSTTIPSSVTHIGKNAFDALVGLESITIPEGVKSIGIWAFSKSGLVEITLPNSLEEIGYLAFNQCTNLAKIVIPDRVKKLGEGAFQHCYNLTSINAGNGVQVIEGAAFFYCTSLESITIGSNVTQIDANAFFYCNNLTNINIFAKTPPQLKADAFQSYEARLRVPQGCVELYKSAGYWRNFSTIVEYNPNDPDGIELMPTDPVQPITRIDLNGRPTDSKNEIQILHMSDGSIKKVYVNR